MDDKTIRKADRLGSEQISSLLVKFAVPSVVGLLVHALYNVVDRVFVGRGVGALGLSGLTMAFPLMMMQFGVAILIGGGATALISIHLGEQRRERAELVLGNALVLLLGASIALTVLVLSFLNPILTLFGTSEAILPYARSYLQIVFAGSVFFMFGLGLNFMVRGEGSPITAMHMMIVGAVLNMILDPILIFVYHMGVQGAALATIISEAVSAAWGLWYYLGGRSVLKIRYRNFFLQPEICAGIFAIGFAPFIMHVVGSIQFAVINYQLQRYGGDIAVAAMGIVFAVISILILPVFGIGDGAQPIIGYNHGARQFPRVKKTLVLAITAASSITVTGFIVVELFPHFIARLFCRENEQLVAVATHALRLVLVLFPIVGFQIVGSRYFQAVGNARVATFLGLSRQALVFIPMLLILPRFLELDGVWLSSPVADLMSGLLTGMFLWWELRHLGNKKHQERTEPISAAELEYRG